MVQLTWFDSSGSVISIYDRVQYLSLEVILSRFYANCTFQELDIKRLIQGNNRCDNLKSLPSGKFWNQSTLSFRSN
jgi:hypothetical protein